MTTAAMGHQARFALDDSAIDANSTPVDINSESISNKKSLIITEGLRGTRSRSAERVREGLQDVSGSFECNPSPA
ncbi:MAG: hypothetical protein MI757_00060, partial [Pirellulales bacterium]|nr:hypothetical protein [Pirellulales bacterium]